MLFLKTKLIHKLFKKQILRFQDELFSILKEKDLNGDVLSGDIQYFYKPAMIWGFCYADLRDKDLSLMPLAQLLRIPFSTETKWGKGPEGFNPNELVEQGKSFLGMGVEELHMRGITGNGVKVAYIDKGFDTSHDEFKGRDIEIVNIGDQLNFHGYACTSRIVGNNLGVAPNVSLLHYNIDQGVKGEPYIKTMLKNEIKAIQDIIKRVEAGQKIDAVGMSASIKEHIKLLKDDPDIEKLSKQIEQGLKKLDELEIPFIQSDLFWRDFAYCYKKDPTKPNEDNENYISFDNKKPCVIEAGKCIPMPYTKHQYKYENNCGCASWSIPQVVGLFCLAKQVNENIKYDDFTNIAKRTCLENSNGVKIVNAVEMINEINKSIEKKHDIQPKKENEKC